jgi:hypothetical protein
LKKVGVVSGFIKKIQWLSCDFGIFWDFSKWFFIGKVMDRVYGSRDHDLLSVDGGLATMEWRGRFEAQEVIMIAQKERERRSLGFPPMVALGGGDAKMATRRRSTEAAGGAPMGR